VKTVVGVIADELGHAATEVLEQGAERPELRLRAWASPATSYRREQGDGIPIDREHDHVQIGRLAYLELTDHGSLWAVGEIRDDVDLLTRVRVGDEVVALETPLYWSASRLEDEDGQLLLDSVSLTRSPARIAARPVEILAGGLGADRRWRPPHQRQLLERAYAARWRHGGAVVVEHERERSHPAELAQLAEDISYGGRPPGKMRHTASYHGVFSVH
jgi:hypothetical protein